MIGCEFADAERTEAESIIHDGKGLARLIRACSAVRRWRGINRLASAAMSTAQHEVAADFDRDTAVEPRGEGRYVGQVLRNWWVDRGPNGGFLAALALRAAIDAAGQDDRRPCALTLHFLVPPREGPIELAVAVERSGDRVTNCRVRMEQAGRTAALGLIALARPLAASDAFDHTSFPTVQPPDALPSLPLDLPLVPPFLRNYELRLALGSLPFAGAEEATTGVWTRTASPRRPDPLAVAAFADGWAPAVFARRRGPASVPSIDLTIHFRDHDWYTRARSDDFVLAAFQTRLLVNGTLEEDGQLWSPDGVLLAHSRQLAVMLD
jgi:acyl-CoA thioesterase